MITALLSLLPRLPTPNALRLCMTAIESLSRSEPGAAALCDGPALDAVITFGCATFGSSSGSGADGSSSPSSPSRSPTRADRVARATGASSSNVTSGTVPGSSLAKEAAAVPTNALGKLNGHLEPAFRTLDRLTRGNEGVITKLRDGPHVMASLTKAVEVAQTALEPAVASLGVRLLARVLGSDINALLGKLEAATTSAGPMAEGEFAASLLASLASDAEVAGRMIGSPSSASTAGSTKAGSRTPVIDASTAGTGRFVSRLIALFEHGAGSARLATSLAQAVHRIAGHGTQHAAVVLGAGAISNLLKTTTTHASEPSLVTATLTALADLISVPAHVDEASKAGGVDFAISMLADRGAADDALATACLRFIHSCQKAGYPAAELHKRSFAPAATGALSSPTSRAAENVALQLAGAQSLTSACTTPADADVIIAAGGIAVAVTALHSVSRSSSSPGSRTQSTGMPGGSRISANLGRSHRWSVSMHQRHDSTHMDGGDDDVSGALGASATSSGFSSASPAQLVAASLQLLAALCVRPEHVTSAKKGGAVRAMLGAYSRYSDDDAVYSAFSALVDLLISSEEVEAAVRGVAAGTAKLRGMATDAIQFNLMEQELGEEGLVALRSGADGSGAAPADPSLQSPRARALAQKQADATGQGSANAVALLLTEDLCLLEAICSSARLASVLVGAHGVQVLTRCIGLVSLLKSASTGSADGGSAGVSGSPSRAGRVAELAAAASSRGGSAGSSNSVSAADRTLSDMLQEEILSRCCNTVTGLGRLNTTAAMAYFVPGLDLIPSSSLPAGVTSASTSSGGGAARAAALAIRNGESSGHSRMLSAASTPSAVTGGSAGSGVGGHRRAPSGSLSLDEMTRLQRAIAAVLYRPIVPKVIVRLLNTPSAGGRKGHVIAAATALGVMSLGQSGGATGPDVRPPLEVVINSGAVEALSAAMRTFSSSSPVLIAACNALGCIAVTGRALDERTGLLRLPAPAELPGVSALATRGASRQAIRELQSSSETGGSSGGMRWSSRSGATALSSLLRLLSAISDTERGADMLKKQGAAEALVTTLEELFSGGNSSLKADEATPTPTGGNSGGTSSAGGAKKPAAGGANGGGEMKVEDAVAAALTGDAFSSLLSLETGALAGGDAGGAAAAGGGEGQSIHSEAITLLISVLSKLQNAKDLSEAVGFIRSACDHVAAGTLKTANMALATISLTTMLALASGAGHAAVVDARTWSDALAAVSTLVERLTTSAHAVTTVESDAVKVATVTRTATTLLPPALRALSALMKRLSADNNGDVTVPNAATVTSALTTIVCEGTRVGEPMPAGSSPGMTSATTAVRGAFGRCMMEALPALATMVSASNGAARSLIMTSSAPIADLVPAFWRLVDADRHEALPHALAVVASVSGLTSTALDGGVCHDGASTLMGLTCAPSALDLLTRLAPDLIADDASPEAVAAALKGLARLAAANPEVAVQLRTAGFTDVIRDAVWSYAFFSEDDIRTGGTLIAESCAGVVEAASELLTALLHVTATEGTETDRSTAAQTDRHIAHKILSAVTSDETGVLLDSEPTMIAVFHLITKLCGGGPDATTTGSSKQALGPAEKAIRDAAKAAVMDADGRALITAAMSRPDASPALLAAGSAALRAIGGASGGAAVEVRSAIAALRALSGLPALERFVILIPEAPAASPFSASSAPSSSGVVDGLGRLDTTLRSLVAQLAGEKVLTATTYRFLFDTLAASIDAATGCGGGLTSGSLEPGVASAATAAAAPSHSRVASEPFVLHRAGMASNATAGGSAPRATRLSMSSAPMGLDGGASRGQQAGSPLETAADEAMRASHAEGMARCMLFCSSILAVAVQGVSRLIGVAVMPNSRAGKLAAAVVVAAGSSESSSSSSSSSASRSKADAAAMPFTATGTECMKFGDPKGTGSAAAVAAQYEDADGIAPAADEEVHLFPPVSISQFVDFLALALAPSVSSGSADIVVMESVQRAAGELLSGATTGVLQRIIHTSVMMSDMSSGSSHHSGGTGTASGTEEDGIKGSDDVHSRGSGSGPTSQSGRSGASGEGGGDGDIDDHSSSTSSFNSHPSAIILPAPVATPTVTAHQRLEIIWAAAARGLLHQLATVATMTSAPTLDVTSGAAADGTQVEACRTVSRSIVRQIVEAAQDASVIPLISGVAAVAAAARSGSSMHSGSGSMASSVVSGTGSRSSGSRVGAAAALTSSSQGSSSGLTRPTKDTASRPGSSTASGGVVSAASGPSVASGSGSSSHSSYGSSHSSRIVGTPAVTIEMLPAAAGSIIATAPAVLLQLLAAAEAVTRLPVTDESSLRVLGEAEKGSGSGDFFAISHSALQQYANSGPLTALSRAICTGCGEHPPASCLLWPLLIQLTDASTEGGLRPLLPARSPTVASADPSSTAHLRVLHALVDGLCFGLGCGAPEGDSSRFRLCLDEVTLPGSQALVGALTTVLVANKPGTDGSSVLVASRAPTPSREQQRPSKLSLDVTNGALTPAAAMTSGPAAVPVPPEHMPLHCLLRRATVDCVTRILGHMDVDAIPALDSAVTSSPVISVYRALLRQRREGPNGSVTASADKLASAATQALRRVCGLNSPILAAAMAAMPSPAGSARSGASGPSPASRSSSFVASAASGCLGSVGDVTSLPAAGSVGGASHESGGTGEGPVDVTSAPAGGSSHGSAGTGGAGSPRGVGVDVTSAASSVKSASSAAPALLPTISAPRVEALVAGGVFQRVALAMGLHVKSKAYAREALRLLTDIATARAGRGGIISGKLLVSLGLDGESMKAIQTAVKRHGGDDAFVKDAGKVLLGALSEEFADQSAEGFINTLTRTVEAALACSVVRRTEGGRTRFFPRQEGGDQPMDAQPPDFASLDACVGQLRLIADLLDKDAVPPMPVDLIVHTAQAMATHSADVIIAGTLMSALARCSDNADNFVPLAAPAVMESVSNIVHKHATDTGTAEAAINLYRALSVSSVRASVMCSRTTIDNIVNIGRQHLKTLLPRHRRGHKSASGKEDDNPDPGVLAALASPAGGAGAGGAGMDAANMEPRIMHYAVQVLANVACDQTVDSASPDVASSEAVRRVGTGCPAGVARIMLAGGVELLRDVVESHPDRARVLEDALCTLSNLAYTTDEVRLHIGRTSSGMVVNVLRAFANDPYLFSMALRAVGNLTRCDENIVSTVAAGVVEGIVTGMRANATDVSVLEIAAEVIGNLASIDEARIDREQGLRALREGQARRSQRVTAPVGSGAAPGALIEGVATWLLDDAADVGLCDAISAHVTEAPLVSACLRSLQYMCDSPPHVVRMQSSVGLAGKVCQAIRACDFDPELCCR